MARPGDENRTVYSTEWGRMCPKCGKPLEHCVCKKNAANLPAGDGIARVRLEKQGRAGKTVTTVRGLALAEDALRGLATELKKACGTGGAVKEGVIEIQGDHAAAIIAWLIAHGHKAKRAGG